MTEQGNQPKRKRRWLRFSLRTFLIVLTILCVWIGWYLYRVEQQREAVKWVLENGGTVRYDFEIDDDGKNRGDTQPSVPRWLIDMLGVDYFSTVKRVAGFRLDLNNENLVGLAHLEHLKLFNTQVSDVTPLEGLTKLKTLELRGTQVSDLTPLASLADLEHLDLCDTQVSDVTPLEGLTKLKTLVLSGTQVSDLRPLASLANLEGLDLSETQVSDVIPLEGLTKLRLLGLAETQFSDVTPLAGLTNLKGLFIRSTKSSDEDFEKLEQALPNCRISH